MRTLGSTYPIILALIVFQVVPIFSLSDLRLCADPKCQEIISYAKASISYNAPDKGLVSFKINSQIRVKSKSAGSDKSLWGIEVNGRQGYAPKQFLREEKILIKEKDLKHIVPVEPVQVVDKQVNVPKPKLNPSEAGIEPKIVEKASEATPTAPLGKEKDIGLNGSEIELEATTTSPILEPVNAEVIDKSMKETVTPVLKKVEIIDGTAIPLIEDEKIEIDKEKLDEKATTTNDTNEKQKANEIVQTDKSTEFDSDLKEPIQKNELDTAELQKNQLKIEQNSSSQDSLRDDQIKLVNTVVDAVIEISSSSENSNEKPTENLVRQSQIDDKLASSETPEKVVDEHVAGSNTDEKDGLKLPDTRSDAFIESEDVVAKRNNDTNSKSEKVLIDKVVDIEPESNKKPKDDKLASSDTPEKVVDEHVAGSNTDEKDGLKLPDARPDAFTESEDLVAKTNNDTNSQSEKVLIDKVVDIEPKSNKKPKDTESSVEEKDTIPTVKRPQSSESPNNAILKGKKEIQLPKVSTGSNEDDEDDFDEEDDEDVDDDEEFDIDDAAQHNFQSSPAQSTTATPMHVTDPSYPTRNNLKYWEIDEIETTTPSPVPMRESNNLKNLENPVPTDETTKNTVLTTQTNEELPKTVPDTPTIEATQVPTTTTLPIFQQPNQPQQQVENLEDAIPNQAATEESAPHKHQPAYDPYQHINQQLDQNLHGQHSAEQSNEQLNNGNPNDFYRLQTEQLGNDAKANADSIKQTSRESEIETASETIRITEPVVDSSEVSVEDSDRNLADVSIEMISTPSPAQRVDEYSSEHISSHTTVDEKRDAGLFGTILGTVNNFVNKLHKSDSQLVEQKTESNTLPDSELQRILFPDRYVDQENKPEDGDQFCEQLSRHHCPTSKAGSSLVGSQHQQQCNYDWKHINMDNFVTVFLAKAFEMRELLSCLAIASSTILLFLFGYYCFCNSNREGALITKLNLLERSLLASHKENAILKDDLQKTRNKLTSIEDNSFGSNDMVIALRKDLEISGEEKHQLEEKIHSLEKELETAAEAGLELNKIVAELISNQTGQESMIMNSVEDLQMQFNEQQKTILEINATLAEKSRENSELQLMLAEQNVRFNGEIASLQQDNDELEAEKSALQTRLSELKSEFEEDISKALEGKNAEIKRLQVEIVDLKNRFEDIHTKWQTSLAKIEALEECMKTLKKDSSVNISDVINVAYVRAELLDLQKQRSTLKSRLDAEAEARQHAELSLQNTITEIDRLKQDYHQSEKDKLEAQTRLEVLSNYFKEKETQLQKELSLKEAIWLKQQGENTSTVDRLTSMQDEIQSLKSQNDSLRAEIEAQLAAHKAQTGTLENRAHETWLAARQSERRFEEARAEAAALRRRLTELAGASAGGEGNRGNNVDGKLAAAEFNNAPSPILPPPALLDANAGSPLLGTLPPPPHQFLPFMGPPPPPFLNLPPPPFLQSVEMRPAPLGRMMSPTTGRYSPPNERPHKRRNDGYYEREYDDYDEDDDYVDDEDDYGYDEEDERDERTRDRRPRRRSGESGWHRDNFSPPPPDRSYRSQSPTDSRYNYTYDDETDLSPPPSPPGRRGGGGSRTGSYHTYSPRSVTTASPNATIPERTSSKKGIPNSDSDKSHNSAHHNKKGKSLV